MCPVIIGACSGEEGERVSAIPCSRRSSRVPICTVMRCGWGVKAGWLIPLAMNVWVSGKTMYSLT